MWRGFPPDPPPPLPRPHLPPFPLGSTPEERECPIPKARGRARSCQHERCEGCVAWGSVARLQQRSPVPAAVGAVAGVGGRGRWRMRRGGWWSCAPPTCRASRRSSRTTGRTTRPPSLTPTVRLVNRSPLPPPFSRRSRPPHRSVRRQLLLVKVFGHIRLDVSPGSYHLHGKHLSCSSAAPSRPGSIIKTI